MRRYHYPATLADACARLAGEDACVYGGGTDLQVRLKLGAPVPSDLIDVAAVPGLADLAATPEGLRIGALVTLRRLETDPLVRAAAPLLADVCRRAANPRVRNTATIGGNLARGEPHFDPPLALLVLGAAVEIASVDGVRTVSMRQFTLDRREIVTAITVPRQEAGGRFVKLSSLAANDRACASAAALVVDGRLRLALGALAPAPLYFELDPPSPQLRGSCRQKPHFGDNFPEVAAGGDDAWAGGDDAWAGGDDAWPGGDDAWAAVEPHLDPVADLRGGVAYKKRLARVAVEEVLDGRR